MFWEQNVSLCINELGVSSRPDTDHFLIKNRNKSFKPGAALLPICIEISPMAQVALLHTEINSGFRLSPRMGINSAGSRQSTQRLQNDNAIYFQASLVKDEPCMTTADTNLFLGDIYLLEIKVTYQCRASHGGSTPWLDPPAGRRSFVSLQAWCPVTEPEKSLLHLRVKKNKKNNISSILTTKVKNQKFCSHLHALKKKGHYVRSSH